MGEGEGKKDGGKTRKMRPYIYKVGKRKTATRTVKDTGTREESELDKK